jgi:hypothetical protein
MSMRILCAYSLFLIFLYSCVNKYQGQNLSVLTINSKMKNSKIVDRYPDYGDGHKDGCIVMSEMQVDLNLREKGIVSGLVSDVTSKQPLPAASIRILTDTGRVLTLATGPEGKFLLNVNERISR